VILPVVSVATQILPFSSTAMLSKRAGPVTPPMTRPPCGDGAGFFAARRPSMSNAHSQAPSVSAT
jgi:hypothetical protein